MFTLVHILLIACLILLIAVIAIAIKRKESLKAAATQLEQARGITTVKTDAEKVVTKIETDAADVVAEVKTKL